MLIIGASVAAAALGLLTLVLVARARRRRADAAFVRQGGIGPAPFAPSSVDPRGRWQISAHADVLDPLPPLDTDHDTPDPRSTR